VTFQIWNSCPAWTSHNRRQCQKSPSRSKWWFASDHSAQKKFRMGGKCKFLECVSWTPLIHCSHFGPTFITVIHLAFRDKLKTQNHNCSRRPWIDWSTQSIISRIRQFKAIFIWCCIFRQVFTAQDLRYLCCSYREFSIEWVQWNSLCVWSNRSGKGKHQ